MCELTDLNLWISITKNREPINLAVLQLKEDGYLEELKKKWWLEQSECSVGNKENGAPKKQSSQNALHLENVAGIFFILIIGLVISIIIVAIEILYNSRVEALKSKVSGLSLIEWL